MNRYGRMTLEYYRHNLPTALAAVPDPDRFFTAAGEQIAASITEVSEQVAGQQRRGETAETYRRRSSQASAMAEELVLADHHLLTAPPELEETVSDDPELAAYYRDLDEVNAAIIRLYE